VSRIQLHLLNELNARCPVGPYCSQNVITHEARIVRPFDQATSKTVDSTFRMRCGVRLPCDLLARLDDLFSALGAETMRGGGDGPANFFGVSACWWSTGPSDCQSMPCCCLRRSKFSLRASRSCLDFAIFSGW
jgi:hypothetical protein